MFAWEAIIVFLLPSQASVLDARVHGEGTHKQRNRDESYLPCHAIATC